MMLSLKELYEQLGVFITEMLKREHHDQGHTLTGELERSITFKIFGSVLAGYAIKYVDIVEHGLRPDQISWKMLPGVIQYYVLRGLNPFEAKQAAFFTIRKWMVEGLSTKESKTYSITGERQGFIRLTFEKPEIDGRASQLFDVLVDNLYHRTPSETV